MSNIQIKDNIERQLERYCSMNGIDDVSEFANRCLLHGFAIIRFGSSPNDNRKRESEGITDFNNEKVQLQVDDKHDDNVTVRKIRLTNKKTQQTKG